MKKTLATLLTSIFTTLIGKVLSALGLAFVSYTGLNFMQEQFVGYMNQNLVSIPNDALQLFYIAGGGVALNYFFGAITFIASFKAAAKLSTSIKRK